MRLSFARIFFRLAIIGAVLALTTGCGAIRVAYNNGPQLGWWWLDGYLDFSSEQTPDAKQAIGRFFEWHRPTQLPAYAALLAANRSVVLEPATPADVCRLQKQVRDLLDPSFERALEHMADLTPGLGEPQLRFLDKRYAKVNAEWRDKFLQPDAAERRRATAKRALERAETLYGRLDKPQKAVIDAGVAASPYDPEVWIAERERHQRDVLQTLRKLNADKADRPQRLAALKAVAERAERSPDTATRTYQQQLALYNCGFSAQVHNATTAAQRKKAQETIKGWEEDARWLAANPS